MDILWTRRYSLKFDWIFIFSYLGAANGAHINVVQNLDWIYFKWLPCLQAIPKKEQVVFFPPNSNKRPFLRLYQCKFECFTRKNGVIMASRHLFFNFSIRYSYRCLFFKFIVLKFSICIRNPIFQFTFLFCLISKDCFCILDTPRWMEKLTRHEFVENCSNLVEYELFLDFLQI